MMLAIFTAACGAAEEKTGGSSSEGKNTESNELTIEHQLGETKVKQNPKKVVVFDFGTLDTMDKLGIEPAGLPKDNIPKYLEKFKDEKYGNTGGLMEPDFEAINELQPDLIIISGRQQDSYEQFQEIAPTIFMGLDTTKYMESFKGNVTKLGQIFDKEDLAKEELAKVEADIQKLNEKASPSDKKALIILANDGKISAYGKNSRFGLIHDVFGVDAADENIEVSKHGQSISFEYIVEKNPDYLFVVDRGAVVEGGTSSAKNVVENDLVKNTNAYKDNNIVYLSPDYWYLSGGGLISVAEMVKEIDKGIE
ncbi:ABC transporter [Bacillus sp. M6-12]|uniref:siderophore ABC transporter substrate-binding protein n=1 Tax=Bacillus sp. M6-12 TaxID=2054166 RepID=UPI000C76606E|nr:siderophore ABC transporter substrate-binding protein [Bacillus sp. M6-12]PLS15996.1 ABC transporter [Bacillus sp. M6-12]